MTWEPDPEALRGKVAVVAGATRGAGKGIAAALGEAGATVICTGRSTRAPRPGVAASDYQGRSETVEDVAELVTALGGSGVPEVVDHLDPDQVAALAQRIRADHGAIDVLVNDIWGGELLKEWDAPVWGHNLANGLRLVHLALDTHLITAHHLLPLLVERPGGLVVEVSDGTKAYNDEHYRINAFYDLAKVGVNRFAYAFGHELADHGATAVCVTPGWLRSELMLEVFATTEDRWRESLEPDRPGGLPSAPPGFAVSESPRFVGRAVVALATDPDRARWNQQTVDSGTLAREYGFTDLDGSRPDVWRHMADEEAGKDVDVADYR